MAALLVHGGALLDAARLVGAAAELRRGVGQDYRPWEREGLAMTEQAFARAPSSVDLDAARADGARLTMEEAIALACEALDRVRDPDEAEPGYPNRGDIGLSPRESEVLALLAQGCSNREIADRLFLSTETVERHLGNLYRKLDVTNRTQAAAVALRASGAAPPRV